ncbi:MAG: transketolase [Gemmatimonadetes bacterium]|nr:transketolase [Gemmatimonadota bacterium]MCY3677453.1 transketolase [Gemmatimonadota bacterium]MXY98987.1 transketolase [Gemmatimonadota bacterium]MYE93546.1 transketolase [Gemmatimonadota bacterium]MYJ10930.1 transketolase [Gemmatimonadota bacterium]
MPLAAGTSTTIEQLAIDTIKTLAMDAVQEANSGHPGTPMALAPVGYALWTRHLRHNPRDPGWLDRDRFVLSAGHASMLIYSLLYLTGYDLTLDDIRRFRQWDSRTPGHPEYGHTPGVETTTGPLGQGVANSVGMALAERWLANRYNRPGHDVVGHRTYALCSDGDLMEGISHEAAEIAGHQGLGKLTWIFDDNRITIEGGTDLATVTDQSQRFQGYGWHTVTVEDGTDLDAIDAALLAARAETERPSLIVLRTTIAEGSPNMAGTAATHGAPLGLDEIEATKRNIGYPSLEPFHVEPAALEHWRRAAAGRAAHQEAWTRRFEAYRADFSELAAEFEAVMAGELPDGWDQALPDLSSAPATATRNHSGKVLQGAASALPTMLGGSADLGGSNKTDIVGSGDLLRDNPGGRIVHFGVREHAMGAIMNGMALHGGIHPFGGTFLIFSDYMRPSIRLAALMGLPVTYVFTHDSIGLGEDGPTHQPIEQLAALRAIPGLLDLRPADGPETAEAWRAALTYREGPSFLALTRQTVPVIERGPGRPSADQLHRGAYVLRDAPDGSALDAVVVASGSEVGIALEAREQLANENIGIRVVSMPSWHLFSAQPASYQEQILPRHVLKVSLEAGSTMGWERWVGSEGTSIGIDRFGASAPFQEIYRQYGITANAVGDAVRRQHLRKG